MKWLTDVKPPTISTGWASCGGGEGGDAAIIEEFTYRRGLSKKLINPYIEYLLSLGSSRGVGAGGKDWRKGV